MASHADHCKHSLKRYGRTFSDLHRWMDEPSTLLGPSHRNFRHDPNETPVEAKRLFGELAEHACLDHIRLDELETRRKIGERRSRRTVRATGIGALRENLTVNVKGKNVVVMIEE